MAEVLPDCLRRSAVAGEEGRADEEGRPFPLCIADEGGRPRARLAAGCGTGGCARKASGISLRRVRRRKQRRKRRQARQRCHWKTTICRRPRCNPQSKSSGTGNSGLEPTTGLRLVVGLVSSGFPVSAPSLSWLSCGSQ